MKGLAMAQVVVESEVTGTVWKIAVAGGDDVAEGDQLMIVESMKMEIPVEAPVSGRITLLHVAEGDTINEGDPLLTIG